MRTPVPALVAGAVLSAGPAAAQAPSLDHTAPLLGEVLSFTVEGASPGAPLALFFSPGAAEIALPQGTLELDPEGLFVAASGTADGSGAWTVGFALPLNAPAAELEAHLQVYEVDAGAPFGGVLGEARHMRLLGSRLYMEVGGTPPGFKLVVFSAVADEEVFVVDLPSAGDGAPPADQVVGTRKEVFLNGKRSLGTYPAGEGVVVFDNYLGAFVEERAPGGVVFAVHEDGESYYACFPDADEIRRFAFESGALLQTIQDVPSAAGNVPVVDDDASRAFVPTALPGGRPAVLVVDLAAGSVSAPVPLGQADDVAFSPGSLQHADGWVIATTFGTAGGFHTLNQFDPLVPAPPVLQTDVGETGFSGTLAVPDAGVVLTWRDESQDPFSFEPWEMLATPIGATGPTQDMGEPIPPTGAFVVDSYGCAVDGAGAWFIDRCCQEIPDGDEMGALWYLDAPTATWSTSPLNLFEGPQSVAVVDDPFGSRVFTNRDSMAPPGFGETAKLQAFDKSTLSLETFELTQTDSVATFDLNAVTVP